MNKEKIDKKYDERILEYILKIPKLKNDLITGVDSFNYTDKQYSDIMQNIQNQINTAKATIKEPKELENKLNELSFQKGELKIERLLHVRREAKKIGNNLFVYDNKLNILIIDQNKILKLNGFQFYNIIF